jgi:hypothetical protein
MVRISGELDLGPIAGRRYKADPGLRPVAVSDHDVCGSSAFCSGDAGRLRRSFEPELERLPLRSVPRLPAAARGVVAQDELPIVRARNPSQPARTRVRRTVSALDAPCLRL